MMPTQTPKFWMVVKAVPATLSAVVRHRTRAAAYAEAERLARKEKAAFVVLESLDEIIYVPPQVETRIIQAESFEWRRTRYQSDLEESAAMRRRCESANPLF